jgi:CRP-like cAMP-binding protein
MGIADLKHRFVGDRLLRAVLEQELVVHAPQDEHLAKALISAGDTVVAEAESVLYESGQPFEAVYFVLHGEIELTRGENRLATIAAQSSLEPGLCCFRTRRTV